MSKLTKSKIKKDAKISILAALNRLMASGDWMNVAPPDATDAQIEAYEREHKYQIKRIAKMLGYERYV
ncbi:MAG: hypothetical protein ACFE0Q_20705 [Anaerolineae bacterium]